MDSTELTLDLIEEYKGGGRAGIKPLWESGHLSGRQIAKVVGLSHTIVYRELGTLGTRGRLKGALFHANPLQGLR